MAILFVDDEAALARAVTRALEALGFAVHALGDGAGALERLAHDPASIEALVIDLVMPGMDGLQLAAAVRAIRPGLPIVLCSAFLDDRRRAEAAALGIAHCLDKPVPVEALARILRAEMGGRAI